MKNISILIPTFNEEKNIRYALESVKWASEVFVVDSFSTDKTEEICKEYSNVKFIQHKFEGYAKQKNWALDNLPWSNEWIFILDADEQITPELKEELVRIINDPQNDIECWYVNRRFIFLGKWIKHCGWYPSWNLRFFKRGKAKYEDRAVDEHMIANGKVGYLKNDMIHEDHNGLTAWIAKHNKYSTLEAEEQVKSAGGWRETGFKSKFFGAGPVEKKRVLKNIFYKLPCRPLLRFLYMYIYKLGFLDGYPGFVFCVLRGFIQEFFINIKIKELKLKNKNFKS